MIEDPIVSELRRHREEHAASYGHDLKKIVAALRERERQSGRVMLNPGPRYLPKTNAYPGGCRSSE
uniref:Uncharacterized protein n=1 Tax=Candidatus Kentrum sp. FM TaxID=2126340 RepID=A0A450X4Y8_9GAMM|nr:MAG: hypothetical protein BECKFM1743C_GA0114222_109482 [Candidatus Kentron sp. FM]VFJ77042.1 MAG: hypothetical protein BECKFM1743A_GA0114220_109572 [Candidatus Kentron sp. FM]VFK24328.1 MAG: hypothetical protein BECKFM1743B_GA0114221_109852 [Candidatus Kentron sp. FM]